MDRVEHYREIVRRLIEEYASYTPSHGKIETEAVVDRELETDPGVAKPASVFPREVMEGDLVRATETPDAFSLQTEQGGFDDRHDHRKLRLNGTLDGCELGGADESHSEKYGSPP